MNVLSVPYTVEVGRFAKGWCSIKQGERLAFLVPPGLPPFGEEEAQVIAWLLNRESNDRAVKGAARGSTEEKT